MTTDLSKLAGETQKSFPEPKPNGTFAPPPNRQSTPAPSVPPHCGITSRDKTQAD